MPKKSNAFSRVYQFKIILQDSKPPIWRRILVPENYTFWDLHVAIQDSMGWMDGHLHQFETVSLKPAEKQYIGLPDPDGEDWGRHIIPDWTQNIKDWFSLDKRPSMNYEYDFGDSWRHKVVLEKILPVDAEADYPLCIAGKHACPPEDCGGVWGYADLQKIIADPKHPEHDDMLDWLGGEFSPEEFDASQIEFSDPLVRLKIIKKHF